MLHLLFLIPLVSASILDQFQQNGIEYEVYGEGRIIPEEDHCIPFTLDLFDYVNTMNTNELTEYGKELLKRRIHDSFEKICETFNISTEAPQTSTLHSSPIRLDVRFMDRFEIAWNALKFERDLKTTLLEHKINQPFLEIVPENIIAQGGSSKDEFVEKSTFFPIKCNVPQLSIESRLCFNISEAPQTGIVYSVVHGGEFLHDDQVYAYYDVPEFVLITAQHIHPIDLAQCKVLFGTYIYCFKVLKTECDVSTMTKCPIMARKVDEDFTLTRPFGSARLIATTNIEYDLFHNGTKLSVPSQVFTLRVQYNTNPEVEEIINQVDMKAHTIETRMFPDILPETLEILNENTPTQLVITEQRGTHVLSSSKVGGDSPWMSKFTSLIKGFFI